MRVKDWWTYSDIKNNPEPWSIHYNVSVHDDGHATTDAVLSAEWIPNKYHRMLWHDIPLTRDAGALLDTLRKFGEGLGHTLTDDDEWRIKNDILDLFDFLARTGGVCYS